MAPLNSVGPAEPGLFPIFLDLSDARVLVIGGGPGAAAKARLLSGAGARILAIAEEPGEDLAALESEGILQIARRPVTDLDFPGARLCYVALDDAGAAAEMVALARRHGVLTNAVDRPALCDFTTPARVERGPVTIAISTGGAAPALARDIRARIEAAVPPNYGALGRFCREWRGRVARAVPDHDDRRRFWDAVLDGPEAAAVLSADMAAAGRLMATRLEEGAGPARRGRASLVGAGPGDPDLLTLAALRAIQRADVILHDKLVDPRVVDLARRDARRVDVGKRCGRHAASQAAINRLILRYAAEGLRVVRLKGGDPFVFGRGGEELEALRAAGVPCEVIPGITAATAVAARLGIPLTHRGLSRGVHLITGHGADDQAVGHDWRALVAAGGTIAVYMGARTIGEVTGSLLAAGLDPATPAIAVENATLPGERRVAAPVGRIAERLVDEAGSGPILVLIGKVVALAASATGVAEKAA